MKGYTLTNYFQSTITSWLIISANSSSKLNACRRESDTHTDGGAVLEALEQIINVGFWIRRIVQDYLELGIISIISNEN